MKSSSSISNLNNYQSKTHIRNTDQSPYISQKTLSLNKTIQFATLNVCGLKTRSNYPDFIEYCNNYDFLCFTETKIDETDVISIPGFISVSQSRRQKFVRRSGGISVYVKENISKYFTVIPSESDYILWFSINRSLTNTEENLIFGVVYIPPENSRFLINDELMTLEMEITETCSKHKYIVLTGDFNARLSNLPDYTPRDTFLSDLFDFDSQTEHFFNPVSELANYSVTCDRTSKDTKTNNNGFRLLEICKNNNLFLVNGRIGCDENVGNFTYRNVSVLDYSIVSLDMFEFYQDFEVVEMDPLFSDGHCLLRSVLRFDLFLPNEENIQIGPPYKPKWKPEYCNDFIQHIDCTKINSLLTTWENTDISKDTINFVTNQIGQIFENATSKAFPKPKHYRSGFGTDLLLENKAKYHTSYITQLKIIKNHLNGSNE